MIALESRLATPSDNYVKDGGQEHFTKMHYVRVMNSKH